MKGQETREIILKKTFYLLLKDGYDGVSISDIQRETGMARGLLYHYFGNKKMLFREAVEIYLIRIFEINPNETVNFGLKQMIDYIISHYDKVFANWISTLDGKKITIANYDFLMYRMMMEDEHIAETYSNIRKKELEAWERAACNSLKIGEIRPLMEPAKIVRHLACLMDGIWMQSIENDYMYDYISGITEILTDFYNVLKK